MGDSEEECVADGDGVADTDCEELDDGDIERLALAHAKSVTVADVLVLREAHADAVRLGGDDGLALPEMVVVEPDVGDVDAQALVDNDPDSDADGLIVVLCKEEGLPDDVTETDADAVGLKLPEDERDSDAVAHELGLSVGDGLGDDEGEADSDALSDGEPLSEPLVLSDTLGERDDDVHPDDDTDTLDDGVTLGLAVPDSDGDTDALSDGESVGEWLELTVSVAVSDTVAHAVAETDEDEDTDAVCDAETVKDCDGDDVALGDRVSVAHGDADTDVDADAEPLAQSVAVIDGLRDPEPVGDALSHADALGDRDGDVLGVELTDSDAQPLALADALALAHSDCVFEDVLHCDSLADGQVVDERHAVTDGVAVSLVEMLVESEREPLKEAVTEEEDETDVLPDVDGLRDGETDADKEDVTECEEVEHEEKEGDKVTLPLSLGELDALLLRVGEGLGETDAVVQSDDDSLALTLGECELLSVTEEDTLPDAQHVSDELTDEEAEDEKLEHVVAD